MYEYYETCFIIDNNSKYFLIDTGGSNDIVNILSKKNISLSDIHDIFISHTHTDHILGLFWLLKRFSMMHLHGKYSSLNVYCNDEVARAIKDIYKHLYPIELVKHIDELINIIIVKDNETLNICDMNYTFFDAKAKANKLYGFETTFNNGETLVFLGDETLNEKLYDRIKNKDYVMHEAFCLDSEADKYKPYEKNHSTVKSVCNNFKDLNIKNLILYHTLDNNKEKRKELYLKEAKKYYNGNVLVPDDLDTIKMGE